MPPSAEGRWTLVRPLDDDESRPTRGTIAAQSKRTQETTSWAAAIAQQLLNRHGMLTRESIAGEALAGGFGVVYAVLKAMEESGRIRRGYFVAGLGATQFAMPGALDLLRSLRDSPEEPEVVVLAATDPANPYGSTMKFPPVSAPFESAPAAVHGESAPRDSNGSASAGRQDEDRRARSVPP